MVRVLIERWLLPGVEAQRSRADWDRWAVCEARERARGRIAPLLARSARVVVLEPA